MYHVLDVLARMGGFALFLASVWILTDLVLAWLGKRRYERWRTNARLKRLARQTRRRPPAVQCEGPQSPERNGHQAIAHH
jgi:hypothetical protein